MSELILYVLKALMQYMPVKTDSRITGQPVTRNPQVFNSPQSTKGGMPFIQPTTPTVPTVAKPPAVTKPVQTIPVRSDKVAVGTPLVPGAQVYQRTTTGTLKPIFK